MLVWAVGDPGRLGAGVAEAIAAPANEVFVSAATAWEIAIKHALGRLSFPLAEFDSVLSRMGFEPLAMSHGHAIEASRLPSIHHDPFDRLLVAQARIEQLVLVSRDAVIARYDVAVLPA